jgi:aminopeptidase N
VVYAKGGFILHMLRRMMADRNSGDQAFMAMMQDFVKTYSGRTASTEDFKAIAEKHMPPFLNLDGNGKLDWFFNQWVYGTEVPSFHMAYSIAPQADGKTQLRFRITQSDVSESFKSPVSVYIRSGDRVIRLGQVAVVGSKPTQEIAVLLPSQPKEVLLNYNHDVLATKSVAERVAPEALNLLK